jgi:hypothetical protein
LDPNTCCSGVPLLMLYWCRDEVVLALDEQLASMVSSC